MNTPPPLPPLAAIPVHDGIEEWMAVALLDSLSTEERQQFTDHLAGCARCRELFAEETAMSQTLQNAFSTVQPLPGFERRLAAAFRQRRGDAFSERLRIFVQAALRRPAVRVLGTAAAAVALVVLGGDLTQEAPWAARWKAPARQVVISLPQTRDLPAPPVSNAARGSALNQNEVDEETSGRGDKRAPVGALAKADDLKASTAVAANGPSPAAMTRERALQQRQVHGRLDISASAKGNPEPLSLNSANSYTGGTTVDGGSLQLQASKDGADDHHAFRELSQTATGAGTLSISGSDLPGASKYGSPIQTSSTNYAVNGMVLADRNAGDPAAPAASATPPSAEPAAPPPPAAAAPETRKLIRNANVELEVAAFDPAVDALGSAATQIGGGYVATVNSARLPNGKRRGTLVIKVLPDKLDAFLARLRELGEVKSQTVAAEDVTKAYFDTDARLRNARRMEDRLLKMLEDAKGKLSEILQVEKELGRVREDIEKMQGELQLYDALVRYATVTLDLHEKDLQQPAKFLLRQTADLALLAGDVEKTYGDARRAAEEAHAQIATAELVRNSDGRATATLRLLLAPEAAEGVIIKIKGLARVQNFNRRDERIAQNGNPTDPGADTSKLERSPVAFNLTISHDEETHRRISFTLNAADAAGTYEKARAAAVAADGEIVSSNFSRTHGTHGSGVLVVRLPASRETSLLDTVRSLGHTADFNVQRDSNAGPDADAAPVLLTLNVGDEQVHHRISLTLVAANLDAAFAQARAAALAAGGEIMDSSFNRPQSGGGSAMLAIRLPGKSEAGALTAVQALGRTSNYNVARDASPADDATGSAPVSLTINFADEEPAVQRTEVAVLCQEVDQRQAEIRRVASDLGAQARLASFEQGTDGSETATVVYRLPLRAYPGFISRIRGLGEVKELNVHREDHPENDAIAVKAPGAAASDDSAPAEVSLRLYSQGRVVSNEAGVGATIRRTLGQGVGALMWSLRMIGVALAFLAPWLVALVVLVWLTRVMRRRRKANEE